MREIKAEVRAVDVQPDAVVMGADFTIDAIVSKEKAAGLYHRPYAWVKRGMDLLFSFILLIPAGFLIAACYIAIKVETKGPAFFVQERPGYKDKLFKVYKLRSMMVQTERDGVELTDTERMTKTGRIIRKLSLDELPQILNVLKGEMSFIGPRPLPDTMPNFWLSCLLIEPEAMCKVKRTRTTSEWTHETGKTCPDEIAKLFAMNNIEARPIWKPMHMQPVYSGNDWINTGVGEDVFNRGLCLPSDIKMSEEEQGSVIELIKACFR